MTGKERETVSKFFVCDHCKEVIEVIDDKGVPINCCGDAMTELKVSTAEAGTEKHLPDVSVEGGIVRVKVGSVPHPMTKEHLIEWVQLETDKGIQRKRLEADGEPAVKFYIGDEKPVAVYAYCNTHGLWKLAL